MTTQQAKTPKRFSRFKDVQKRYADAPASSILGAMKDGRFPKSFELYPGSKIRIWSDDELDEHDAKMRARRDGKAGAP